MVASSCGLTNRFVCPAAACGLRSQSVLTTPPHFVVGPMSFTLCTVGRVRLLRRSGAASYSGHGVSVSVPNLLGCTVPESCPNRAPLRCSEYPDIAGQNPTSWPLRPGKRRARTCLYPVHVSFVVVISKQQQLLSGAPSTVTMADLKENTATHVDTTTSDHVVSYMSS